MCILIKNEIKIFNNEEFGSVRIVNIDGKTYFVANDVAKALGYSVPKDAVTRHCKGALKQRYLTEGGEQELKIIPEGDIYRLIIKSKLSSADKFERWIFDEIIPTIRKTGGYVANDDLFIETYLPYADEETKALFRVTLNNSRKKNEIIEKQKQEIQHKENVIVGLVDDVTLAEKRQILNRVVRYNHANYYERWSILYREFENKYHIDLQHRFEKYNETHKPKCRRKLDYIDKVMNKVPELYEIAVKLYENDIKALVKEMYDAVS